MIFLSDEELDCLSESVSWFSSSFLETVRVIAALGSGVGNALYFLDRKKLGDRNCPLLGSDSVLITNDIDLEVDATKIIIQSPWVEFAKVSRIVASSRAKTKYKQISGAWVAPNARIASDVRLEPGVVVGNGCEIGSGCWIGPGSNILNGVKIGKNCRIHSGVVLGADGFGYAFPVDERPAIQIAHLGGLEVGNDVDIGPRTVVCSGTIDPTEICEGVKIDGSVYIGHNAFIGQRSMICAGAVIGGSAKVGSEVWVHAGSKIKSKNSIGDGATVGLGAVVIKSVGEQIVVMGDVAEELRGKMRKEAAINRLIKSGGYTDEK